MTLAGREIRERHFVTTANLRIHLMHLPGESVRWKPFGHRVGIKERFVDFFGRRSQNAVKSNRVSLVCCHNISFQSVCYVPFRAHFGNCARGGFAQPQFCAAGATLTIQPIPNRSPSMPKADEKNVFVRGIFIFPPSVNALKTRSASASLETRSPREKPSK